METLAGAADEGFQIGHSSSLLSLIHQYQYPPIPFLPLLLLLAQMHWWGQQQPHRSFHPQLPAQRSHSEITQTVVTFVGNSCSPLLAIVQREKNQVGRPKHLRVKASPRVENKVSDFVRINIIDKTSAENAVDDRPSKRIPELDSLTLLHVAKGKIM